MKKLFLVLMGAFMFSASAWAAVDINTATQAQLETLEGVGPAKAQAIIDYRKKNGPFKSTGDLDKVPGFGDKTMEALKKDISVSGGSKAVAKSSATEEKPKK